MPVKTAWRCKTCHLAGRQWRSDNPPMLHVVLHQPEIPSNTGNVIRLCANSGARLHLIRPLGFAIDDARLRRAGLDYHEYTALQVHEDFAAFVAAAPETIDATGTTGALSRVDKIVSGHGGLGAGRVRLTKDRLKRFSLLTSRVK